MKKSLIVVFFTALAIILLAGCAPGMNNMVDTPDSDGEVAGFWMGLWHGAASPVMFIISLFNDQVEVFEVHNNGGWYSFGFLMGASIIFGGSGGSACGKRRRNRS